jgi:hypothetical protein
MEGLDHRIHAGFGRHLAGALAFHLKSLPICVIGVIGGFNSLFQADRMNRTAPSREDARKHPVHLVHPVQNPEYRIPCASVGQDWLAGWFAPEVGMSSVEPDGESTTSENENAREWGHSRA